MNEFLSVYVEQGDWQRIEICISGGFPIEKQIPVAVGSEHKYSLLHLAALHGQVEVAQHLLQQGAKVASRSKPMGDTPLHCAAEHDCVEMAELLLKAGARVNAIAAKDLPKGGNTPLHYAAKRAQSKMIATLLANGADPNFQNNWGETPLHHLAFPGSTNGRTDRVLAAKAFVSFAGRLDLRLKDKEGKTAIQVASQWTKFYPELHTVVSLFVKRDRRWWRIWTW